MPIVVFPFRISGLLAYCDTVVTSYLELRELDTADQYRQTS